MEVIVRELFAKFLVLRRLQELPSQHRWRLRGSV